MWIGQISLTSGRLDRKCLAHASAGQLLLVSAKLWENMARKRMIDWLAKKELKCSLSFTIKHRHVCSSIATTQFFNSFNFALQNKDKKIKQRLHCWGKKNAQTRSLVPISIDWAYSRPPIGLIRHYFYYRWLIFPTIHSSWWWNSLTLKRIESVLPGVEHDHEDVAGAVPHPHHDGCVPVIILLVRCRPNLLKILMKIRDDYRKL